MKNCAWRLGTKYGIAYMEDNGLACELLKMEGISSRPSDVAMATYYSPKGKAYAWQVKFDMDRWDGVARKLGLPIEQKTQQSKLKSKPKPRQTPKAKPRQKPAARTAAGKLPAKPVAKTRPAKQDSRRSTR